MRKSILALAIGTALWMVPVDSAKAQFVPFNGVGVNVPAPYVTTGFRSFNTYSNPYGYSGFRSNALIASPYGFAVQSTYGNFAQPFYTGPYHSVYRTPTGTGYIYGPGYRNTPAPSYGFYNYQFGW